MCGQKPLKERSSKKGSNQVNTLMQSPVGKMARADSTREGPGWCVWRTVGRQVYLESSNEGSPLEERVRESVQARTQEGLVGHGEVSVKPKVMGSCGIISRRGCHLITLLSLFLQAQGHRRGLVCKLPKQYQPIFTFIPHKVWLSRHNL